MRLDEHDRIAYPDIFLYVFVLGRVALEKKTSIDETIIIQHWSEATHFGRNISHRSAYQIWIHRQHSCAIFVLQRKQFDIQHETNNKLAPSLHDFTGLSRMLQPCDDRPFWLPYHNVYCNVHCNSTFHVVERDVIQRNSSYTLSYIVHTAQCTYATLSLSSLFAGCVVWDTEAKWSLTLQRAI